MRKVRENQRQRGLAAHPWTAQEITLLELMAPHYTWPEIALRLGRTLVAVQHKASAMGISQQRERAEKAEASREYYEGVYEANLRLSEDDLSAYLPECDEEAVLPHYQSRTYYRMRREQRRSA